MSNAEQAHISPEQLEEAACGRLPAHSLAAVEAHCAVCSPCRTAYDQELLIVRGTRSWARAALKARIASRVAQGQRVQVPWTRILAAAAVLLVIAGTGIYYQWLRMPPASSISDTAGTAATGTLPAPGTDPVSQEFAEAKTPRTVPPPAVKKEAVQEEHTDIRTKRESESLALAPAPAEATPAVEMMADHAAGAMQKSTGEALIMWGNILPLEGEAKAKAGRARDVSTDDARMEARGAQMQGARTSNTYSHARYIVDQEVILPMYRRDAGSQPGQVPSRITRTGDTLHIVLLLDSRLPDDVIRSATVHAFPPDSIQIHLPGKVLGFRTPAGFIR
ncbi:MAG: hypothetical protein IPI01_07480 [Ignavibacteriae bacterium]|nr:hypothetical protein [Ignavibacteriota bacterium]